MAFRTEQEKRLEYPRDRILNSSCTEEERQEPDDPMRQAHHAHQPGEEEVPSLQEILRAIQMENEDLAALLKQLGTMVC